MSYRAFEDKNGLIKHFNNLDIEFEVVTKGLSSLKKTDMWGAKAKDLETRFIAAMDGVMAQRLPLRRVTFSDMANQYIDQMRADKTFVACDALRFRKVHDECIRFFQEVRDAFDILTKDDRRGS